MHMPPHTLGVTRVCVVLVSGSEKVILLIPLQGFGTLILKYFAFQHKKSFFVLNLMRKFLVSGTLSVRDCKMPIRDIRLTIAIMVRHSIFVITLPYVY